MVQGLRSRFGGPYLVNTGFAEATTRDEAVAMMADDLGDAVVVGRALIANPDLVRRWREELGQNELNISTLYAAGATGYTDYPAHQGDDDVKDEEVGQVSWPAAR
jgi:N-ethylmaleimide reductase